MSAHTPGPWQVGIVCGTTVYGEVASDNLIADTYGEDAKANARLIAAAPRMLELLRETHSLISDHFSVDNPLARAIYDVIRRDVEGESNG